MRSLLQSSTFHLATSFGHHPELISTLLFFHIIIIMLRLRLSFLFLLSFSAVLVQAWITAPPPQRTRHHSSLAAAAAAITSSIHMDEPAPEVDPRRKNPDDQPPANPVRMPVIDTEGGGQMDVLSRLLKDRILLLGQGVDDEVANVLVAQLLYLANEDPEKDITLYINSPGGSVSAGMAIYDSTYYYSRSNNRVLLVLISDDDVRSAQNQTNRTHDEHRSTILTLLFLLSLCPTNADPYYYYYY